MLNAKVLSTMMKANVRAKLPITIMLEGQGDEFFDAMAEAIVTHFQSSAMVVIPPHEAPGDIDHFPGKVL